MRTNNESVSAYQYAEWEHEKTMFDKQVEHVRRLKELEIEVAVVEARFNSWLKLPATILKLPVLVILAIGYCIDRAKGSEPSERFWELLK